MAAGQYGISRASAYRIVNDAALEEDVLVIGSGGRGRPCLAEGTSHTFVDIGTVHGVLFDGLSGADTKRGFTS